MDIGYLLWLQGLRQSAPDVVQAFFSFMGSHAATVLTMLIPCVMYWCIDKQRSMLALMSYGMSSVFNQLLKNTVCCYRPWVRDPRVTPDPVSIKGATGYSFPSGHTQSSSSVLGGFGWAWREKRWPMVLGLVFALMVGFSRNFLGVHTPQDVAMGFAEGLAFVFVCDRLIEWADQAPWRDLRIVLWGCALTALYLVYVTVKPYPMDYVDGKLLVDPQEMLIDCYKTGGLFVGVLSGWFVERYWIDFHTGGLKLAQILSRLIAGALVVLVLYVPVGHAIVGLAGEYAGQFIRHALTFFAAVAVVPMLYLRLDALFGRGEP
jgi:membrane-associated phospholipid phosphatase